MKKLLEFLLYGCFHKWEVHDTKVLVDQKSSPIGKLYILRCTRCGEIKNKKIW